MIVYEAGVRTVNGKYATFFESPNYNDAIDYFEIMKTTIAEGFEATLCKKEYSLICTTPMYVHSNQLGVE